MEEFLRKINFPYVNVRTGQGEFIKKVYDNILKNKNLLVSAPTGLGKTISAIAPALKIAKEKNLTIIYLTSRQTQANQAIKTIRDISEKSGISVNYVAFTGKRSMCVHTNKLAVPASDFNEFCKKLRSTGKCKYYKRAKDDNFETQIQDVITASSKQFMAVEGFISLCDANNLCPYEVASLKTFKTEIAICDFNYLFSGGIFEAFLGKIGRTLEECIVIVDEAHNLPDRIRNAHSYTLSFDLINNALKELKDFFKTSKYDKYILNLRNCLSELSKTKLDLNKKEILIKKDEFISLYLSKFEDKIKLKEVWDELFEAAAIVKEDRTISFAERCGIFLKRWSDLCEESYLRLIENQILKGVENISLKLRCIDPGEISAKILNHTYSSILMSGTLSPIMMYKDILGVANAEVLELESPFEKEKQLTLVINDITSKYSARSSKMYAKIAKYVEDILGGANDKNAIFFFPSYDFLDRVVSNISLSRLQRKVLKEKRYMTKEEKEDFVNKFKFDDGFNSKAKVLFAITSGSFSEGLDLPNKTLELVGVVGLPLGVPDVFTKAVIRHFDKKFGKGQMYGYVYPAMNKIVQAAGRCIRTNDDQGVVVLMDLRFMWPLYAQTYPLHWKLKTSINPKLEISNFFEGK